MPDGHPVDDDQPSGVWLGIDFGLKRIGVAVGNTLLGTAEPLSVMRNINGTPEWATLDAWVQEWLPAGFVIGLPLSADGEVQEITQVAKGFGKRCAERYSLPVRWMDERYSSIQASETIAQLRRSGQRAKRTRKEDVDTLAAALILERWFASRQ